MDCLVRLMLGGLKTRLLTTCTKLGFVSTQCKQSGVGSPIATGKSLVWIFLKKYKCQYSPLLRKCDVRRKKWRQFCLLNFPGSLSNQCQLNTNSLSFSFSFVLKFDRGCLKIPIAAFVPFFAFPHFLWCISGWRKDSRIWCFFSKVELTDFVLSPGHKPPASSSYGDKHQIGKVPTTRYHKAPDWD